LTRVISHTRFYSTVSAPQFVLSQSLCCGTALCCVLRGETFKFSNAGFTILGTSGLRSGVAACVF
jgi:hypothetical protein